MYTHTLSPGAMETLPHTHTQIPGATTHTKPVFKKADLCSFTTTVVTVWSSAHNRGPLVTIMVLLSQSWSSAHIHGPKLLKLGRLNLLEKVSC